MLPTVIQRNAARRAQPALAGSSAQPIEVRSWFEPAWLGLDLIVVVRINLSFIVGVSMTFKKMMHPMGLGEAQEEQEERD